MEEVIVRFIDGPLGGEERVMLKEMIQEFLGAEELNAYSLGATKYQMRDIWIKNDQEFAEYKVVE